MKLVALALGTLALTACKTDPPPSPVAPTASSVFATLVDAGCLGASGDGIASIAEEHARADQPAWLACLFDGGTVTSCGVPCQ